MVLCRRGFQPAHRLDLVPRRAAAEMVGDGEVVLGLGMAGIGGLQQPADPLGRVERAPFSPVISGSQAELGEVVAPSRRFLDPAHRLLAVLVDADPFLVEAAEQEGGLAVAALGGAAQQLVRDVGVADHALAVQIAKRQLYVLSRFG